MNVMNNVVEFFVVKLLGDQQSLLVSAAIKGLSLIGSAAPLCLPDGGSGVKDEAMEVDGNALGASILLN